MVLTITDSQSHTYAFHNRSGSGPEERGAVGVPDRSSPAEFYHIPEDSEGIPIRRGSLVRQVGNNYSMFVCLCFCMDGTWINGGRLTEFCLRVSQKIATVSDLDAQLNSCPLCTTEHL